MLTQTAETDRARRARNHVTLQRMDDDTAENIRWFGTESRDVMTARIAALRKAWGLERYLQLSVAAVGLTTVALAITHDRRWGYVTGAGLALFLVHALLGANPPRRLLRSREIRSRAEINQEIYALKVLRGDFQPVDRPTSVRSRIGAALKAVDL